MRRISIMAIGVLALWSAVAAAQVKTVEAIPFGGYRWSTGLSSVSGVVTDIEVNDAAAYGVALDVGTAYHNSGVELYWSHFKGELSANVVGRGPLTADFSRDDILINGIWYAVRGQNPTRPYFTAGLGVAIFDSKEASAIGRFAWEIGAGLRHDVNERAAIRADFRYMPVWITTGSGVWCDPFYCYETATGEFFDQFEVTGGLIFKLGGRR